MVVGAISRPVSIYWSWDRVPASTAGSCAASFADVVAFEAEVHGIGDLAVDRLVFSSGVTPVTVCLPIRLELEDEVAKEISQNIKDFFVKAAIFRF